VGHETTMLCKSLDIVEAFQERNARILAAPLPSGAVHNRLLARARCQALYTCRIAGFIERTRAIPIRE